MANDKDMKKEMLQAIEDNSFFILIAGTLERDDAAVSCKANVIMKGSALELGAGLMHLREWVSNNPDVMDAAQALEAMEDVVEDSVPAADTVH